MVVRFFTEDLHHTLCFSFIKLQVTVICMGEFKSVSYLSVKTKAITFFEMKGKTHKPKPCSASRPILLLMEGMEDI